MRQLQRGLEVGDFAFLNDILEKLSLPLESTTVDVSVLGSNVPVQLSNIVCSGLSIGDITVDWQSAEDAQLEEKTAEKLQVTISLLELDLDCVMDYAFQYLFLSSSGVATLQTNDNTVTFQATISIPVTSDEGSDSTEIVLSPDSPPTFTIDSCTSDVQVESLVLDGDGLGLVEAVVNAAEDSIRDTVATEIESTVCFEIINGIEEPLSNGLAALFDLLIPYLEDDRQSDPLQVEETLRAQVASINSSSDAAEIRLLDFQDPGGSTIGVLADLAMKQLMSSLDLNKLIRDFLLQGNTGEAGSGFISIDMSKLSFGENDDNPLLQDGVILDETIFFGKVRLALKSAAIYGLDTFNNVIENVLPIGHHTFETSFELNQLKLQLQLELAMSDVEDTSETKYVEDFEVQVSLSNIRGEMAILLGIDENVLGSIPLGAILQLQEESDALILCILSSLYKVQMTKFDMSPLVLDSIVVSGLDSPGLKRILINSFETLFDDLKPLLSTSIPQVIEYFGLTALEGILQEVGVEDSNCSFGDLVDGKDAFVDFRDMLLLPEDANQYGASGTSPYGGLLVMLKNMVDDEFLWVDPESGLAAVNERLIAPLTQAQSGVPGSLVYRENLLDLNSQINIGGLNARMALSVGNARIEQVDTVGSPLFLADPVMNEAHLLNNTATLGVLEARPLRMAASIVIRITTDDEEIYNEIDVGVSVRSANAVATLLVKMLESRLLLFPLEDVLNIHCWLSTMPAPELDSRGLRTPDSEATLSLDDASVSLGDVNLTLDCRNCTGEKFEDLSKFLMSPVSGVEVTRALQNLINFGLSLVKGDSSLLQTEIDRLLARSPQRCPHRPEFNPAEVTGQYEGLPSAETAQSSILFLLAVLVAMGFVLVAVALVTIAIRFIVAIRNRRWIRSLPETQAAVIYCNQKEEKERRAAMDNASRSMVFSEELPLLIRIIVPIVLLGNISLFLSGHLSKGGEVRIYLQLAGDEIIVDDFYSFSIAQSGIELWNAGAKELAILLLLFSGAWPYTKQLVTLGLWFLPPNVVSLSRRGSILYWLDALAKWSMIDVFVMIITLAAFRVTIESPTAVLDDIYQVDLLVVPVWGLYANMLAQLLSQVTSHIIIGYHRKLESNAAQMVDSNISKDFESSDLGANVQLFDEEGFEQVELDEPGKDSTVQGQVTDNSEVTDTPDRKQPLRKHSFSRPHRGETETLRVRKFVSAVYAGFAVVTVALVLVGCILPSFSYNYLGLLGIAMESGNEFREAIDQHSIFSIAQLLVDQARFLGTAKDYIGLGSIASLLVITTLFVPVAQCCVLLCEWFVPLTRHVSNKVRVTTEILQAWQYVEVYLLAVIVGAWQIGDLSEFLVNSYCGSLEALFAMLAFYEIIKVEDAQCFRVQTAIESASYILIAASVCLLLLTSFVSMAASQRARDERSTPLHHGTFSETSHNMVDSSVSRSNDEDAGVQPPVVKREKITSVPVLFTDQFRWLLSSNP